MEFHGIDGGPRGGSCTFAIRYASGASNLANRPCLIELNGLKLGSLLFETTKSWDEWDYTSFESEDCEPGRKNSLRITARTAWGGPNIDRLEVILATMDQR